MSDSFATAPGDPYRYGVYLRPDPRTCLAVTQLTGQLRAQYGFVSAGAFPPHATLVGSQHVPGPEQEVVDAVAAAVARHRAFEVVNAGISRLRLGWIYDVHHLADGNPNTAFRDLAVDVDAALAPLRTAVASHSLHAFDPDTFHAHLSLASHDLHEYPHLGEEVGEYLRGLPVDPPPTFRGDTVALYRTRSADWSGRWWHTLTWEHVRTWRLTA